MFLSKLHRVKAFVFDVDGVLTDGAVYMAESGDQSRKFNIRDGYALKLAVRKGYTVCAISGGKSKGASVRLESLGVTEIFMGAEKKIEVYRDFVKRHDLLNDEVLFMGDDIPDIPAMKLSGLPVCPADAAEEVKRLSSYISPKNGGEGCVRDVIEKVLKLQGNWYNAENGEDDEQITST